MKLHVVVHEAEEGGYWAEAPAIPGCCSQGETYEQALANICEAAQGCLQCDITSLQMGEGDRIIEISV